MYKKTIGRELEKGKSFTIIYKNNQTNTIKNI